MEKDSLILRFYLFFNIFICGQTCLYGQTPLTLDKAYKDYLFGRDKKKVQNCETAFLDLGKFYFFQKPNKSTQTYDALIQDRLDRKLPLLKHLKEIDEFQKFPLLFLSSYVYYQSLAYKPNDTTRTYTERANKWQGIKSINQDMLDNYVRSNEKVSDEASAKLLKRIMRKGEGCVPPRIRDFAIKAIGASEEIVRMLNEEIRKDTLELIAIKKNMEAVQNGLKDRDSRLKKLKLGVLPLEIEKRVADIDKLPIHKENVRIREEIAVPEFALGAYCDNNVEKVAKEYAERNVKRINDVMDVRDDLVAYYKDVYTTVAEYKKKYPNDTIPALTRVESYANSPIEIEVYVTGKADGSGGCYQKNWGDCLPIGYIYDGQLDPINTVVEYSFDGGKKIAGQINVKSPSSSKNSNTVYVIERGKNLNNLSLAFLRGYCFGKKVENALQNNPKNTKGERYKFLVAYKAFQYEKFYDDKSRAFLIEMSFINTNQTINDYQAKIDNDIRKIDRYIKRINGRLRDMEEAAEILNKR